MFRRGNPCQDDTPLDVLGLRCDIQVAVAGVDREDLAVMATQQQDTESTDAEILVGPLLRYADATQATVWVETSRACRVSIITTERGEDAQGDGDGVHSTATWSAHGHHYALLVIEDLRPASVNAYTVELDGRQVWPVPDHGFPEPVIRTMVPERRHALAFGSCRTTGPFDAEHLASLGPDALVAMARRMADSDVDDWPDTLLMLGDQIYADNPPAGLKGRIAAANDNIGLLARGEIQNFEQYTLLYQQSWMVPEVRWLLSTVPSCMLLDDHDLRDDWNTSYDWRQRVTGQDWWRDRVVGAYGSYWVYQHLGNLSPREIAESEVLEAMRTIQSDEERTDYLDEFAWRIDTEPSTSQFSFVRDLGGGARGTRLVAVDSRCARVLDPDGRRMIDEEEWGWIRAEVLEPESPYEHLLFASTLPVLMLPGLHHLEGWNEAVCQGNGLKVVRRMAEMVRQAVDLEHWAAFRQSMHEVVDLLGDVVRSESPPSSVLMLAGDVHCSYTAPAELTGVDHPDTVIHQLVMSPFRHGMPSAVKMVNRLLDRPTWSSFVHRMAKRAGVEDVGVAWQVEHGQWYDNGVMTITLDGRTASVEIAHTAMEDDQQVLVTTMELYLGNHPSEEDPDRAASKE